MTPNDITLDHRWLVGIRIPCCIRFMAHGRFQRHGYVWLLLWQPMAKNSQRSLEVAIVYS